MSTTGYGVCTLIFFALCLPLPIVQVIYGAHHQHDYNCESFIGISDWLIVKGSTMLGAVFIGLLMVGFTNHAAIYNKPSSACCALMLYILYMCILFFQTAWLIVGSIIFWRDCVDVAPTSVNDLMWASLIIGYIDIFFAWLTRDTN
jgi:hypothetical protein